MLFRSDIFDGRNLRHDPLVVTAREAVELFDRHLLHPHAVTDAEVFQLRHQLPFGTFADVEFLDLASSLDGFGHGTYPENNVVHSSLFFICPGAGGTRFSRISRKSLFFDEFQFVRCLLPLVHLMVVTGFQGKTSAELTMEEKNRISHRGKALEAMKQALKEEVAEK